MNTRPPPPQGAPPSYAFVTRMYSRSLRPVVIAIASLSALYSLFSAIGRFRGVNVAREQNVPKLATFSIVLGSLLAAVAAFETFGVVAASMQRLALVRIYAFLSALTALIIVAASLIEVVVHFTNKNDIISECTSLSTGSTAVVYPYGFFGPVYHDFIDGDDAARFCRRSWDHDSWADIVALLILIVLAGLFTVIAFAYYRQVLDPSSVANVSRAPQNRVGAFHPSHYNPAYNASVPNLGYGYNMPYAGGPPPGQQPYQPYPAYAPPAGPPPRDDKPPGYVGGDGKAGAGYEKENPFADFNESEPSRRQD